MPRFDVQAVIEGSLAMEDLPTSQLLQLAIVLGSQVYVCVQYMAQAHLAGQKVPAELENQLSEIEVLFDRASDLYDERVSS